ncbi:hypothetical protein SO802_017684 [Lithocarpus litseifolius]|uniref:Uncharacterized protein n=1 Tax=Lithocarpus litseifolius TaxID=425828 RepID=A0AAW2CKC6_9ROSI
MFMICFQGFFAGCLKYRLSEPPKHSLQAWRMVIDGLDADEIVGKVRDKETNMASMRKQFLEENQGKQGDNNYEFKRRDKDDGVFTTDGTNEQSKKKKLKKT